MEKMSQTPTPPSQSDPKQNSTLNSSPEVEHRGSIWSHPYMVYIVLTIALFILLCVAGWWALSSGVIPTR